MLCLGSRLPCARFGSSILGKWAKPCRTAAGSAVAVASAGGVRVTLSGLI
jgi:hypothetical protein